MVSAEIDRSGIQLRSRYNAAALRIQGMEPQYQQIRTIDLDTGRPIRFEDEDDARRVVLLGAEVADQLFGTRPALGETMQINGLPYAIIGTLRYKEQDGSYSGPDNDKIFIPLSAMVRDLPLPNADPGVVSNIILEPVPSVIEGMPAIVNQRTGRMSDVVWPLDREIRRILGRRHGFDPADRDAGASGTRRCRL